MNWKNIVNIKKLSPSETKGEGVYEQKFTRPATEMGAQKLGFNVRTLPPGKFSCPYHFHHAEEELFLVLEGTATLRQADKYREISEGDLIFFCTGAEGSHQLYNHSDKPCKLLAISSMDPGEVAEYPDSKKIFVSAIRKVFQNQSEVNYLKDETDPAQHWPRELLRKGP